MEITDYSPAELLKLISDESSGRSTRYLLSELVWEYVEKSNPELGWMGMDKSIGKVVSAVLFDDTSTGIEDFSRLSELCGGIMHGVYTRAMMDCAAMLGVESGSVLEDAVCQFAMDSNYGRDGAANPIIDSPELRAAIKRTIDGR